MGAKAYGVKCEAYRRSRYDLTRQVCEFAPEEWGAAHIEARQRRLAELAVAAWNIDFEE